VMRCSQIVFSCQFSVFSTDKVSQGQGRSIILRFRGAGFEPAGCQCIPDGIP
jgi:hypothetical protein